IQEIERQLLMVLLENIPEQSARPKRENESLLNGPQVDTSKAGIDNMVARHHLPLGKVAGLAAAYVGLQFLAAGLHYAQSLLFNR
ncbi:hypothetical protein ONJ87_27535, partial [Salmonella enterica subsp. enterica serovar Anatum]|nr:hypothetical protein [Salmonella enterica subsp. enterica serovar Anatum]